MTALQIRGKGTITLPASLRKKYKLEKEENITLDDLLRALDEEREKYYQEHES